MEAVLEAEDWEPKLERLSPLSLTTLAEEEVEVMRQWLFRALVFSDDSLGSSTEAGNRTTSSRLEAEAACTFTVFGEAKHPATAT